MENIITLQKPKRIGFYKTKNDSTLILLFKDAIGDLCYQNSVRQGGITMPNNFYKDCIELNKKEIQGNRIKLNRLEQSAGLKVSA